MLSRKAKHLAGDTRILCPPSVDSGLSSTSSEAMTSIHFAVTARYLYAAMTRLAGGVTAGASHLPPQR